MGKIAKIFGGGKPKAPPPLPPLPTRADPEIEAARRRQKTANKLRKGRRSSILTSSSQGSDNILGETSGVIEGSRAKLLGE